VAVVQDQVDDRRLLPVGERGWIAADGCPDDGEDARADDRADAESGERDGAESFFEGVLRCVRVGDQLVDGFGGEDLAGQCARPRCMELL
jgi:hypothetical protein